MPTTSGSVDIDLIKPVGQTTIEAKNQKKEEIAIYWEEKTLHDHFGKKIKEVRNQDWWK